MIRVTGIADFRTDHPAFLEQLLKQSVEVLRRQGLLAGTWCLDPHEQLSPGQSAEIDRVYAAYPELNDDAFVAKHLDEWLRP